MDTERFDHIARTFSTPETRRGLLRLMTALPLAGALAALVPAESEAGRRHRRTARHRHQTGNNKEHRTGKGKGQKKRRCAQAGQTLKKGKRGKRKGCCAGLIPDASGRCAAAASPPLSSPSPTCLSPTTTSATQGLQEAIAAANPGDTLTLCAGTWAVREKIVIAKNLTLRGAGAGATTLDRGEAVLVLRIEPGVEVMLQDLTITKGSSGRYAGGGIFNDRGTLTLLGVSVTGNTARHGGGIFNLQGTLTLQAGSHVSGNTAYKGGGIFNYFGTVTLQANSRVSGNIAEYEGGGIHNPEGTVTVNQDALVCNNTPADSQCDGVINGPCPNPTDGFCRD